MRLIPRALIPVRLIPASAPGAGPDRDVVPAAPASGRGGPRPGLDTTADAATAKTGDGRDQSGRAAAISSREVMPSFVNTR